MEIETVGKKKTQSPVLTHSQWLFYYDCCFPFSLLSQWLTLSKEELDLEKREFSFSVSRNQETFYLRWQHFFNAQLWRSKILSMDPLPNKIDIGAKYSLPIRSKDTYSSSKFKPVEKEIVFDIDMDDYDDIRSCCKGKTVCCKCWTFLAAAADTLEQALRDDFGFKHIFWVFSGRRGIHCWVCDPLARVLPSEARAALVDYLSLVTASGNQTKKVRLFGNVPHPFIQRSYQTCLPYFEKLLSEQKFLDRGAPLVKMVDDYMSAAQTTIRENFFHKKATVWNGKSHHLWEIVLECCLPRDKMTPIELVLSLCYPRLDVNVSKDTGHLLKMPFCVHEATGKICVPIPKSQIKTFDPDLVPTLAQLQCEYMKEKSLENTAYKTYVNDFSTNVVQLLLKAKAEALNTTAERIIEKKENGESHQDIEKALLVADQQSNAIYYE